jgi:hypothetical protein
MIAACSVILPASSIASLLSVPTQGKRKVTVQKEVLFLE